MNDIEFERISPFGVILLAATTLFLLYLNPVICLFAAGVVAVFLIIRDYRIGLFILAGLAFTQLASLQILEAFHVYLLCFALTFLSFLYAWTKNLELRFRSSAAFPWLAAFLLFVLISGLYAESNKYWKEELYSFVRVFIVFFLVIQGIDRESTLKLMGKVIVLSLFASSLISFLELVISNHGFSAMLFIRFLGILTDPNDFAMTLCGALPLAVYYVKSERKFSGKALFFVCLLVFIFFIIITQSRGGIVAAVLAFFLMIPLFKRKLLVLLSLAIAFLFILTQIPADLIFFRILQLVDMLMGRSLADPSFVQRMTLLKSALAVFFSHPLLGVGANNFVTQSVRYIAQSMYAHNMFVEVGAGLGLAGLIPFTVVIFLPLFRLPSAIRTALRSNRTTMTDFLKFFRVSYISMIITSMFLSSQTKPYLWIIVAMAYAILAMSLREPQPNNSADR